MNAMEVRPIEYTGSVRQTAKEVFRYDFKRIKGTARGFAVFGSLFSMFECVMEKGRKRSDPINSFLAGGASTAFLAMDSGMRWKGLLITGFTGGMFGLIMEKMMGGRH